jgi:predicted RNA-binding Zn-ribbon protein involved in translation (DUF1610 family)
MSRAFSTSSKEEKMKYAEAIQRIDTEKALVYLGFEVKKNGSYLEFPCPACGNKSSIRYHGEKKNVSYCSTCKSGSNIIAMAVMVKGLEFQEAKNLLLDKTSFSEKPIEEELNLNYELLWCKEMENFGLDREICERLGVGKPKGKTMLSGTITFTVHNEEGLKVAYFGLKPDGTGKFHQSFNPELYLYNYHNIGPNEEVWITKDMLSCLRLIFNGKQAVCNFGLPYLSVKQYLLLSNCDRVTFEWSGDKRDVAYSNIVSLKTFYRFA